MRPDIVIMRPDIVIDKLYHTGQKSRINVMNNRHKTTNPKIQKGTTNAISLRYYAEYSVTVTSDFDWKSKSLSILN